LLPQYAHRVGNAGRSTTTIPNRTADPASEQPTPDGIKQSIALAIEARFGAPVIVRSVEPLGGGAHRSMQRVELSLHGEARQWVLCRVQPGASGLDPHVEHDLLAVMAEVGVPVPAVHFSLATSDGLGMGYVMELVDGETIARRILADPRFAPGRAVMARQCGEALARIHAVDPHRLPSLPAPGDPTQVVGQRAARWRSLLDRAEQPQPALEVAVRWLETHSPRPRGLRLVHGDFRLGNLLVGPDGLRAVLDWELASFGDPMEDLGWLCTRAWRWGNDALPVGGFGTRDELFAAYEAAGGGPVDADAVRYWEVAGCVKWAFGCLFQASRFLDGSLPTIEMASLGRKACEPAYDALTLIDADRPLGDLKVSDDVAVATNQQAPSADQLAEAVASWLAGPLTDASTGVHRFEARIAANLVRVLRREAQLGPAADAADRKELRDLLGVDGSAPELRSELVGLVRIGALPLDDRVIGATRRMVARQLLIANPAYLNGATQ
jgi:aminoglycoside phosphotransferase (APT) family kinase protein